MVWDILLEEAYNSVLIAGKIWWSRYSSVVVVRDRWWSVANSKINKMGNKNSIFEDTLQKVNEFFLKQFNTLQDIYNYISHICCCTHQLELTNLLHVPHMPTTIILKWSLILYIHNKDVDTFCCLQFHGWSISGLCVCVGADMVRINQISTSHPSLLCLQPCFYYG